MPDDNKENQENENNQENNNQQTNNSLQTNSKSIVLGCDSNGVNDEQCLDIVAKALEAAGYTVETLGIAPGPFADYSYGKNGKDPKGKIGVYLMAASLVSFLDAAKASFDFNVFGIRGDVSEWGKEEGFKTKGVPKDHHGDCTLPECNTHQGKTYPELNEIYKDRCCAVPGETPEKLAQNIIAALGGQYAGAGQVSSSGSGAQIKDKTFEDCIKRICAATDSVFIVENNAAVLFPYTDWMAFTLRHKIQQIRAKDIDPDLFEIDYNTDGFYNKVTVVWGADEEQDKTTSDKTDEEEKKTVGNVTTVQKTMPTGGTQLSEQYDPLVKLYGELEKKVTTNFPNEETAHFVMNALLIQYIRDFNNSCRARVINNQKFIGGTFYAVESPKTKESELFYLNSYTMFKEKGQPLVTDMEFKYGPEGAEELLDYQFYSGSGGGAGQATGSSTEAEIWKGAGIPCHQWTCGNLRESESDATDPQVAEDYYNKKVQEGNKFCLTCYGMSSWLYYQFNNKANIPCRIIGNDEHHVVEIYKNNAWYKPIDEYRQYTEEGYHYNSFCKGNAPVLLDAKNPPSGSSTNANASGNTANQSNDDWINKLARIIK